MLLLKDTEQHPDVDRTAQTDRIAKERAEGYCGTQRKSRRRARHCREHLKRSVPNPVYDQLKVKLIDADTS